MTNSRNKGARGEREAAKKLKEVFGKDARRGQQFSGSSDSPDVVFDSRLHLEVKRVEKLNIDNALDQAKKDSSPKQIPVVMHRRNGKKWKMTLLVDDIPAFASVMRDIAPS